MIRFVTVVAIAALALPSVALADHHEARHQSGPAGEPAEAMSAAHEGAKADYLFVWDDAAGKLTGLAEAFPAETYAWRPAEGVRSVGEAFQHVAASVYLLSSMMGVGLPADVPQDMDGLFAMEKKASKPEVTAALAKAFAFGRRTAEQATSEQLNAKYDFFGNQVSGRAMFMLLSAHLQEHLGQEIAYARSNGVVPPWSRPQPKADS